MVLRWRIFGDILRHVYFQPAVCSTFLLAS